MEARVEHPHRCTAGHRWQHTGAPAAKCEVPAYDPVTGDLPFVTAADCPVCCGQQDLLVRELHPHYCNLCDGDWDHEGVCVDSLAAYCPWCFPKPNAEPVPGARRGSHFHYCSECGHNWQHQTACSAPLRAALPECTECRAIPAESDGERRLELVPDQPARPTRTLRERSRALRERARPLALPVGIAAAVLLSLPLVFKGYSILRSPAVNNGASVVEPRSAVARPAATPIAPMPAPMPPPPAGIAPTPAPMTPPPAAIAPRPSAIAPPPSAIAPPPPAIASPPAKPTPEATRPAAPTRTAKSTTARDVGKPLPAPAPHTVIEKPSEVRRAPSSDLPSQTTPRPTVGTSGHADDSRSGTPAPTSPRSEIVAGSTAPTPEVAPAPSDSGMRATPVVVTLPSIPGAPPFSGLTGSSARDPSLDGHPRRVTR
jgi:hypothetical protein